MPGHFLHRVLAHIHPPAFEFRLINVYIHVKDAHSHIRAIQEIHAALLPQASYAVLQVILLALPMSWILALHQNSTSHKKLLDEAVETKWGILVLKDVVLLVFSRVFEINIRQKR